MSDKGQKRRKVWVNFHESDPAGDEVYRKRFEALGADGSRHEEPISFIELRRGDVVLSREDIDSLAFGIANALWGLDLWGLDSKCLLSERGPVIAAIIRDFRGRK